MGEAFSGRTVFPRPQISPGRFSGDFAAVEARGEISRELSRGDQECIFTCRPASPGKYFSCFENQWFLQRKHSHRETPSPFGAFLVFLTFL